MKTCTIANKKPYALQKHIGFNGQLPLRLATWSPGCGPESWTDSISNAFWKADGMASRYNTPVNIVAGTGYAVEVFLEHLTPRNANVLEVVLPPRVRPPRTN